MGIRELYKIRDRKAIKTAVLALVFPDPGLIIESIIEMKRFDAIIRREAINREEKPVVVVCPNGKVDQDKMA